MTGLDAHSIMGVDPGLADVRWDPLPLTYEEAIERARPAEGGAACGAASDGTDIGAVPCVVGLPDDPADPPAEEITEPVPDMEPDVSLDVEGDGAGDPAPDEGGDSPASCGCIMVH
jgi:hypothetical protein